MSALATYLCLAVGGIENQRVFLHAGSDLDGRRIGYPPDQRVLVKVLEARAQGYVITKVRQIRC